MKKSLIISAILCFVVVLAVAFVIQSNSRSKLLYSQEYVAGQGNIKGNVNVESFLERSEHFAIGANSYGYAVFKDPEAAFAELMESYSAGIEFIQSKYDLEPLSASNYEDYGRLADLDGATDEEKEQAAFLVTFFDIYGNSYKKH